MPSQSMDKQNLWKSRIDQYRASGLSAKEWSNKNDISFNTLKYWITRLNKKSNDKPSASDPVFVEVPAKSLSHSKSPILIHLGNVSIEISDGCNTDLLYNLMEILKNYA